MFDVLLCFKVIFTKIKQLSLKMNYYSLFYRKLINKSIL